ncbi:MAG: hypothetical protein DYH06_00605 [Acidobacteria bacterium ACB2]|nr:hypothetical protein [Acidobacteria bacterium ACB2]
MALRDRLFQMVDEAERHEGMKARDRDEKSPVWDMSQERAFIETLLNQRFNFLLVFFSLVLAGAVNAKVQLHFQLILTLGAIVTLLFSLVLARSQQKLDLILADLFTDPTHPATIIDQRAGRQGSRRRLIGTWIPRVCTGILVLAAVLAWSDVLHVATLSR